MKNIILERLRPAFKKAFSLDKEIEPTVMLMPPLSSPQMVCKLPEQVFEYYRNTNFKHIQQGNQILIHFEQPESISHTEVTASGSIQFYLSNSYALKNWINFVNSPFKKQQPRHLFNYGIFNFLKDLEGSDFRRIITTATLQKCEQTLIGEQGKSISFICNEAIMFGIYISALSQKDSTFNWNSKQSVIKKFIQDKQINSIHKLIEEDRLLASSIPVSPTLGTLHRQRINATTSAINKLLFSKGIVPESMTTKMAKNKLKHQYLQLKKKGVISIDKQGKKYHDQIQNRQILLEDEHGYTTYQGMQFYINNLFKNDRIVELQDINQESLGYKWVSTRTCNDLLYYLDRDRKANADQIQLSLQKVTQKVNRQFQPGSISAGLAFGLMLNKTPMHHVISTSDMEVFTICMALQQACGQQNAQPGLFEKEGLLLPDRLQQCLQRMQLGQIGNLLQECIKHEEGDARKMMLERLKTIVQV